MNPRAILLLVVALLVAGGAAYLVRAMLSGVPQQTAQQQQEPEPQTRVLVAASDLPAGVLLTEQSFRWQAWPADVDPTYLIEGKHDAQTLIGTVIRRGILAGEPITNSRVVRPGDRGLVTAILTPGMRAVTIPVGADTGVAGLITPGDRVDLVMTRVLPMGGASERIAENVLENIRVLAIDQIVNDLGDQPIVGRTITLEVTPEQATRLIILKDMGQLTFTLRGLIQDPTPLEPGQIVELTDEDAPPTAGTTYTTGGKAARGLTPIVISRGKNSQTIGVGADDVQSGAGGEMSSQEAAPAEAGTSDQ